MIVISQRLVLENPAWALEIDPCASSGIRPLFFSKILSEIQCKMQNPAQGIIWKFYKLIRKLVEDFI